jgi:hypothetical protein
MKHSTASREEDVAVENDIVQVVLYRPPPDPDACSSPSAGTIPGGRQHTLLYTAARERRGVLIETFYETCYTGSPAVVVGRDFWKVRNIMERAGE